jgi:hypothetical protein
MNTRFPLWLLRDWPALLAVLVSFWAFCFAGFTAGRRLMRGERMSDEEQQAFFALYARAESCLDHAIWRQAWRACGYSAKHAQYVLFPTPASFDELEPRYRGYLRALRDMEHLVIAYADELRRRFSLSKAEVGDPNASRATRMRFCTPHINCVHRKPAISCTARGGSHASRSFAQARAPPARRVLPVCRSTQPQTLRA